MNSARICWSRRSSVTSSMTSHRPAGRDASGAEDEARPVPAGDGDLLGRRADLERRARQVLGVDGDERTDQAAAGQRAGRDAEERVSGGIGADDPQVLVDDHDPEVECPHEIGLVVPDEGRLELGLDRAVAQGDDGCRGVMAGRGPGRTLETDPALSFA